MTSLSLFLFTAARTQAIQSRTQTTQTPRAHATQSRPTHAPGWVRIYLHLP